MKIGIFIALLVLAASTEVSGQRTSPKDRSSRPKNEDGATEQVQLDSKPITVVREETKPVTIVQDISRPVTVVREETKPVIVSQEISKPVTIVREETKPVTLVQDASRPVTVIREETKPLIVSQEVSKPVTVVHEDTRPMTVVQEVSKPITGRRGDSRPVKVVHDNETPVDVEHNHEDELQPVDQASESHSQPEWDDARPQKQQTIQKTTRQPKKIVENVRLDNRPTGNRKPVARPTQETESEREDITPEPANEDLEHDDDDETNPKKLIVEGVSRERLPSQRLVSDAPLELENNVHVSGSINLAKYRPWSIDSVQYDTKGGRPINDDDSSSKLPQLAGQDAIAAHSRVILYVSTMKTIDRKAAFANFTIHAKGDHFPVPFDVNVHLPNYQRNLLETADIALYFFAYITNPETRIDTFLPDGTSQILLQGTNRVVQKLQVNVKASGIEVKGLFRGRYNLRNIRPGTAFQVLIVPEQNVDRKLEGKWESIAQLTLNHVSSVYPVPWSLLVPHQALKPNTKYFAIAYIFENGEQRLIHPRPILVINEQKLLVSTEVIFNIIPHPFVLRATVTRTMPGPFYFEPNSTIILSFHETDSETPSFTYRLPNVSKLPQEIQANITRAPQFDATKTYEIRAMINDGKNRIYMTNLERIPLLDEVSRLTIPVDDLYYYVQTRLHSTANQPLNYIPGSRAKLIIAESPDTISSPIFTDEFDPSSPDFREYAMKIPIRPAQRYRNCYLIFLVDNGDIITHVSKILLISNNQPPPLRIELPVIALNVIRGNIYDSETRRAQWSSTSYANLYLLDDQVDRPEKAIVQVWKIHLEKEFPIRFEVQVDFGRLLPGHSYSLQAAIENEGKVIEYIPASSAPVIQLQQRIKDNVNILVKNVKKHQSVNGLVYINDANEPLPENSQIIVQLSSSPSLTHPIIINETRLNVNRRSSPVPFSMDLPLDSIDLSAVYYFFVQYTVGRTVVIPASQAFAYSPRNEATVVLRLSKTPQIRITGQAASTGGRLLLPAASTLHLYITDSPDSEKPLILSEVRLQASTNSYYAFTMYLDSIVLQKNITLYLRADVLHERKVILSMPRPALLQITPGGEWNINLVLDLPTILIGQITTSSRQESIRGDFQVHIEIVDRPSQLVVHTAQLSLGATLPQAFRVEIDSALFLDYPALEARAVVKNCKEEILFQSGGSAPIHARLNIDLNLPVVLSNPEKLRELHANTTALAPIQAGQWLLSITGTVLGADTGLMIPIDNARLTRH